MTIYWLNILQSYLETQKMPTAGNPSALLDSSKVQVAGTSLIRQLPQRRSPALLQQSAATKWMYQQ
jgi:hypothetical protein